MYSHCIVFLQGLGKCQCFITINYFSARSWILLWNIQIGGQYPNFELTNTFMISLRFSKLTKLDNRAKALWFWLALSQIVCTCSVKDSLLSMVTPNNFSILLFCVFSHPIETFLSSLVVIKRWHLSLIHWQISLAVTSSFSIIRSISSRQTMLCHNITCYANWLDNKKKKSHMWILKRSGPSIEPWGTPKSISCHMLYSLSIFTR